MADQDNMRRHTFPRWANLVVPIALVAIGMGLPFKALLIGFALNPTTLNVGYQPIQPVAYSHELHAGQLKIDCRYCHTTVEDAAFAAIPPTQTCVNCHQFIKKTDRAGSEADIARILDAYNTNKPLQWKQVHDLPDYAYFNHSVHINVGVSCVECHGRVDKMDGNTERVSIVKSLSMGWCLECHRNPSPNVRPAKEVFNLGWGTNLTDSQASDIQSLEIEGLSVKAGDSLTPDQRQKIGHQLYLDKHIRNAKQMTDCSACHR